MRMLVESFNLKEDLHISNNTYYIKRNIKEKYAHIYINKIAHTHSFICLFKRMQIAKS